jgi:ribonuclease P protein subunit POP4
MHINARGILKKELIGLTIKITGSKNRSLIGIRGKVIDETRNTLLVEENQKIKKIPKNQVTIKVGKIEIDGKMFIGRPEERLKR